MGSRRRFWLVRQQWQNHIQVQKQNQMYSARSLQYFNIFCAFISLSFQYILCVHFNILIYSEPLFHEIKNQCVVRFHLKDLNLQFDKTSFSKKVSLHFNKFSHHQSLYNKHYSFQDKFLSYICPYLRAVNPTAKVRLTLYTYSLWFLGHLVCLSLR